MTSWTQLKDQRKLKMDNIDKRVFDYIPKEDNMPWPKDRKMGAMAPAPLPRREPDPRFPEYRKLEPAPEPYRTLELAPEKLSRVRGYKGPLTESVPFRGGRQEDENDLFIRFLDNIHRAGEPRAAKTLWDLYRRLSHPAVQEKSLLGKQTPHRITPATRY